jgi:hypothetical protein
MSRLIVTPGYFEALRVPLVEGRRFLPGDTADAPRVAIVNRALARQFFPGESPLGRRIKRGTPQARFPWMTIVGVVGDVKLAGLLSETATPAFYIPHAQSPEPGMTLVAWTEGANASVARDITATVRAVAIDQPLGAIKPYDDVVLEGLAPRRLPMLWVTWFAALALGLCGVGVHGLVTFVVATRRREHSLRLALGASRSHLTRLTLTQTLWPIVAGAVVGLVLGRAASSTLTSQLVGAGAFDPLSFALAFAAPTLIGAVSALGPIRRIDSTQLVRVLRDE